MVDFINLNTPIGISALLIAIMGALSEGVSAQIGEDPAHRSFWDRISNFLQTQVQFEEIGLEGGMGKAQAVPATRSRFKKKLQDDIHRHLSSLVERLMSLRPTSVARLPQSKGSKSPI